MVPDKGGYEGARGPQVSGQAVEGVDVSVNAI
jgi:hypothetical protein